MRTITRGFDQLKELLDLGRWTHHEIPARQMLWILTVGFLQFMGDYWLRHAGPNFMEEIAKGVDKGVLELFETTLGINTADWSAHATERIRLPLRMKGCGLREMVDRRHGQFVGAMLQSVLPLMDRRDSNNCSIPGRLDIPSIKDLFGEGSFNHPYTALWEMLLKRNPSGGLKHAWSHLQTSFQEVSSREQLTDGALLLSQGVGRAGFYQNGTITASVTKAIILELEKARATRLGE